MNPQESQKLEMYILLCQCSHALITSLMNASKRCSPYVQVAIRQRMFQLAESLRLFLGETSPRIGTPERSLRGGAAAAAASGHGSRLDRSLEVSRGSERGGVAGQEDLNASVRPHSSALNDSSILERPQCLNTSTGSRSSTSHSSRFPVLQQFLAALSEIHDQSLTNLSGGPLPVVDDPRYSSQLMQEIDRVIGLTSGNVAGWGEATLEDRLGKLEISVGVMVDHFRRLEQRQGATGGSKERVLEKVAEKVLEKVGEETMVEEVKKPSKESLKLVDSSKSSKIEDLKE